MLGELVRRGPRASMRQAFRRWAESAAKRYGSSNIVFKAGSKRILLVGGAELSHCILATPPGDGLVTGDMKRKAMSFLAPQALTISDGTDWQRRREFNVAVLQPGRTHELAPEFLTAVRRAFAAPPPDVDALRSSMRRAMLQIIFGPDAPPQLGDDVDALIALVQSPARRALLGRFAKGRRERFHAMLRRAWEAPAPAGTLLAVAHAHSAGLDDSEVLDQIPHWMFTFTGSGTDLLVRTLVLVLSHPEAHRRQLAELSSGAASAATLDELPFVHACLTEAAHLYPPVTRTFHHTTTPLSAAGVAVSGDVELATVFPLLEESAHEGARRFQPDRWVPGARPDASFDPFLGGARRCPGRNVILFVCKAAIAELLVTHRTALANPALSPEALPAEFPSRGLLFRSSPAR